MAKQERYFIGPTLLGEIRETITRVDAIAPRTSGAVFDPRLQSFDRGPTPRLRLGKTSAEWTKGTTANIYLYHDGTPGNETQTDGAVQQDCVNKFATVAANKWVMLGQGPFGAWYLIAAEC